MLTHPTVALRRACWLLAACLPFLLGAPMTRVQAATGAHILTDVPATPQAWALSCEYAATSAATAQYGTVVTQWRLRASIDRDANPHKGFRGDITGAPGGTDDYGVYAEPIATVLQHLGFRHSYVFYGGVDNLRAEVAAGRPVVTWVTGTWQPTSRQVLRDGSGDRYSLARDEHAVTVYGYDDAGVWVMDPAVADKYHVVWPRRHRATARSRPRQGMRPAKHWHTAIGERCETWHDRYLTNRSAWRIYRTLGTLP